MKPIRLMAGMFTVGVWTLLSRVLGFVRDIMIASFLGTGPVAEAFLVAFSLPNLFRRFFAEGAFNMAFVPMFSKKLEADEDPQRFAQDAFVGMAFILTVFTVIGIMFMPWLVSGIASGYIDDNRFDLAVEYGRWAFPYILFISLAALLSGVLNATGRFTAAAAAPVLLNIIFVAAMVLASTTCKCAPFENDLLVGRQVASYFEGAVAWLNYADRLYQLPLGVVGIAIGVVLLPDLSRRLRADDVAGGKDAFNRAAELSLALTIPAAVALIVIPSALVSVMFQRGAFGPDDTAATALAVAIYGLGLPAFVLQKTLQPLFFAREDTKRPFYYAVIAMVLNAALAVGLAPYIGFIAAAVGTTLTGWAMVALLWNGSRKIAQLLIGPYLLMPTVRYVALLILVVIGIVSYFGLAQLLGAVRLGDMKAALRR